MKKLNFGSKSGVTLIELLVVILIVIILAVSLLPILKPFVVKAKYAAEGVPTIGHMRTLVTMFYTEHDRLPGVQKYDDNEYATVSGIAMPALTADNAGDYSFAVQSLDERAEYAASAGKVYFDNPTSTDSLAVDAFLLRYHFASDVELSPTDLLGKNAKPHHFQYMVMDSGQGDTSYAYVVGSFGHGDGVPAGTGYAVVEIVNPNNALHPKITAVWQRYKEEDSTGPICLSCELSTTANFVADKTLVDTVLPIPRELIDSGAAIANDNAYIVAMENVGWEIF